MHIDDGRHYLLTTDEKFDGITSDPLDPWVKGAAALYTREFFELVRARLKPGGVVTIFVQLYESTEEAIKSEMATFFEVFPNGAVFANTLGNLGYDVVLFGQVEPGQINVDGIDQRLRSPQYRPRRPFSRCVKSISIRRSIYLSLTPDNLPTSGHGSMAPRSIATATCGCSISPAGA